MSDSADRRVLARNTAWSVIGYAVQFLTPILLIPYIVSRVTTEVYGGVWVTLFTLASWLGFYDVGLWGTLTRDVAERHAKQDREGLKTLWATWLTYDVVVGVLLCGAAIVAAPEIVQRYVRGADRASMSTLFIGLAITSAGGPIQRHLTCTLNGLQRLDLSNVMAIAVTPIWAAGQVLALEGGWGLKGLMVNGIAAVVLQILILLVLIVREGYPVTLSPARFSAAEFRRMIGFGWKMQAGYGIQQAFRNDRIVMGQIQAQGAMIAIYQFGAGIMAQLSGAVMVLSSGVLPAVSEMAARGETDRVRTLLLRGTKYHALAALGLIGFAACFGHELMMFWMKQSLPESVTVLRIMAVGAMATAVGSCGQSVGVALGRPGWSTLSAALGLGATVFLYTIVGRRYDYVGLASSVSAGLALSQVVFMIGLRRFLEFRWREYVGNALIKPAVLAVPLVGVYAGWGAMAPYCPAIDSRLRAFLVLTPAFLLTAALGWALARLLRVVDDVDLEVLKSSGRRSNA